MERIIKLYELHREAVFRYFLRMTGNWEEAGELTQETFYQACLSLYRFKGKSSLKTWLFSISRNVYLKSMREKGRLRAMVREGPLPDNVPAPDIWDSPAETLLLKEDRERVRKGLSGLPERARTIIILKEYEGLSYADIAEIFGQTTNWARVTFFRARKQLGQVCREQEDDAK
jgi:RNA polymerase sigma-70 factor (ECF subfamily)